MDVWHVNAHASTILLVCCMLDECAEVQLAEVSEDTVTYRKGGVSNRIEAPPSNTPILQSGKVEAIEIHHLVPCCHKVVEELLLGVLTTINFRQGP